MSEDRFHPVDGPEKVDCRGACGGEESANLVELGRELFGCEGGCAFGTQGYSHRSRDADGRCTTNDHGHNDVSHLLVVGGEDVGLFEGKLGLVYKPDAV